MAINILPDMFSVFADTKIYMFSVFADTEMYSANQDTANLHIREDTSRYVQVFCGRMMTCLSQ